MKSSTSDCAWDKDQRRSRRRLMIDKDKGRSDVRRSQGKCYANATAAAAAVAPRFTVSSLSVVHCRRRHCCSHVPRSLCVLSAAIVSFALFLSYLSSFFACLSRVLSLLSRIFYCIFTLLLLFAHSLSSVLPFLCASCPCSLFLSLRSLPPIAAADR